MTVNSWEVGEVFTARIYKRLTSRPDVLWANTYEFFATQAVPDAELSAVQVLITLATWESQFHSADVTFDRGVFSTHVEDGTPYDPTSFVSTGFVAIVGRRAAPSEPLSLQNCLLVRRQVGFGRTGRLLYRRAVFEGDVSAPGGEPALGTGPLTAIQALVGGGWDGGAESPGVLEWVQTGFGLDMVMVGRNPLSPGNIRVVDSLQVAGVVVKDYNNAFYNRRTPPLP